MFKPGDRVRCVNANNAAPLQTGAEYEIAYVSTETPYLVTLRGLAAFGPYFGDRFERVESVAAPDTHEADMRAFFDACIQRHLDHVPVYGDKSFHSTMMATLTDMEQELLDMANYAAYQYYKLRKLREALETVRDKLTGKEGGE